MASYQAQKNIRIQFYTIYCLNTDNELSIHNMNICINYYYMLYDGEPCTMMERIVF